MSYTILRLTLNQQKKSSVLIILMTINSIYQQCKHWLSSPPPLPTELFTFPLGLTMGVLFPPCVAWSIVATVLITSGLLLWRVGALWANRSIVGRSLFVLLLWGGLFLVAPHDFTAMPLGAQALLLVSYLVSSIAMVLFRWFKAKRNSPSGLCIRGRILRVERLRFERILIISSLGGLLFQALCAQLCPVEHRNLLHLASTFIILFTWAVYALETVHLIWVQQRLEGEEWIPILSDDQCPIGRVSKTSPASEEGRLPVVRLLAISRDMIYLEDSESHSLPNAEGYDTPFLSWLTEGNRPEQVAQRMIDLRFCGIHRVKPRFLLHYHEQINDQALSVYLFAVDIAEPNQLLIDCLPTRGKWWPIDLLTSELERGGIARYLCTEYPYLEQTLLLAHRLRSSSPHT